MGTKEDYGQWREEGVLIAGIGLIVSMLGFMDGDLGGRGASFFILYVGIPLMIAGTASYFYHDWKAKQIAPGNVPWPPPGPVSGARFCTRCAKPVSADALFCQHCDGELQ